MVAEAYRDDMQALTTHDEGARGEEDLFMLADLAMQRAAALARTDLDAASAVIYQLLPQLAR